jgi:hypothetical protein
VDNERLATEYLTNETAGLRDLIYNLEDKIEEINRDLVVDGVNASVSGSGEYLARDVQRSGHGEHQRLR